MSSSIRVCVVPGRFPPVGAVDFAAAALVRRALDLVSGLCHAPAELDPDVALEGGRPAPWLFHRAGSRHVVLLHAGSERGSILMLRAQVFGADGSSFAHEVQGALDDPHPAVQALVTEVLARLGVPVTAAERARLAACSIPRGPAFAHFVRYWAALYREDTGDADREIEASAAAGYAGAHRQLGRIADTVARHSGMEPEAARLEPYARKAAELDPYLAEAHATWSELLSRSGRPEEGLQAATRARQWAPENARLWADEALALVGLTRFAESLTAAREALARAPAEPRAVWATAAALQSLGREEEALEVLAGGAAARPDSFYLAVRHACALVEARRYPEGRRSLESCMNRIAETPWWRLPFKSFHLDYHDSTRLALLEPLALATAGTDGDIDAIVEVLFQLHPAPASLVSPDHYASQIKMTAKWGGSAPRPSGSADGGISDLVTYARTAAEVDRATNTGHDLGTVLAHFGLDATRWMQAQTFWTEKVSSYPNLAIQYAEELARFRKDPPPMPDYPRPRPVVAAAPIDASGNGGVSTIEDWARISGVLQSAMQKGQDFSGALATAGVTLAQYQSAAVHWSALISADTSLGTRYFEAMQRYI
jgi:Flp pilus assembly protein TadD